MVAGKYPPKSVLSIMIYGQWIVAFSQLQSNQVCYFAQAFMMSSNKV